MLREIVEASVRAGLPGGEAAAAVASRLLRQTERVSVRAYCAAAAHAG